MYKVTVEFTSNEGPLQISTKKVFHFNEDSDALEFCNVAKEKGCKIVGYESIAIESLDSALATLHQFVEEAKSF